MDNLTDEQHLYAMQLNAKTYLDSRTKGAIGRFINHSCEPNCIIEIWSNNGVLHVGIFTIKEVAAGAELSFDYQWPPSKRPPTVCNCGTPTCRGHLEVYLNKKGSRKEDVTPITPGQRRKGQWRPREEAPVIIIEGVKEENGEDKKKSSEDTERDIWGDSDDEVDNEEKGEKGDGVKEEGKGVKEGGVKGEKNIQGEGVCAWLVGKVIRVWWVGNLRFYEALVGEYSEKTGKKLLWLGIELGLGL
jgi:hypothetical protein